MQPQPQTSPVATERTTCRSCHGAEFTQILDLGTQTLPRFLPPGEKNAPKAPLILIRCDKCGLLQLQHTVNPDLLFREFWYRTSINQTMRDAMDDLVNAGCEYWNQGIWLDIGANDGYLLSRVPPQFRKLGCEPAQNMRSLLEEHADRVISDYFSYDAVHETCQVITSAAMFYDIDDPDEFVGDIAASLHKDGVWINQLNDSPTMLKQHAFDAICHEHLCYYDVPVLQKLYQRHGLTITRVTHNDVNGGSIRVFAQKRAPKADLIGLHGITEQDCHDFSRWVGRWKEAMTELIDKDWWCYGASTKGMVLMQYLGVSDRFIGVADKNPAKLGKVMGGCWLPVVSEDEMRKANPKNLLVLPWAFRDEFVKRETQLRESGTRMVFPLPNIEIVV